jgi:hypothetical protein
MRMSSASGILTLTSGNYQPLHCGFFFGEASQFA